MRSVIDYDMPIYVNPLRQREITKSNIVQCRAAKVGKD